MRASTRRSSCRSRTTIAGCLRRFAPACIISSAISAEVDSVINYTLQGRLGHGVRSLGRFVINSTLGIGGLFDVAAQSALAAAPTGFGTTLAKWGMHPGPYWVIPILRSLDAARGHRTGRRLRHLVCVNVADLYRGNKSLGSGHVNAVDQRANIDFRYYASGSPFEYETIRFLYVRKLLIEDAGLPAVAAGEARSGPRRRANERAASAQVPFGDRAGGIVATGTVLAILYLARDVLVPITLAVILSLLISPVVRALRRLGAGADLFGPRCRAGAGRCALRLLGRRARRAGGAHGGESAAVRAHDPGQDRRS